MKMKEIVKNEVLNAYELLVEYDKLHAPDKKNIQRLINYEQTDMERNKLLAQWYALDKLATKLGIDY